MSNNPRQPTIPLWYAFPFVGALALIGTLYWGTFTWWWFEWTLPGSFYAHAVFVPFFVLIMIWRNRQKLLAAKSDPSWLGILYIIPAMALLLIAQRSDVTTVKSISFMLLLMGVMTMVVGKSRTRLILFPLLFILMMMPLVPDQLINTVAFPIQITSAKIATGLLKLLTLESQRQGTLIQMEHYQLSVELPCSGFKTLVALLTFSAAFAYLVEGKLWKRWTLFLSSIPLSLVVNGLRITFIGIVGELISAKAAATFHDWSGFIVLTMAFVFLYTFAKMLRCERFLGIPLDDDEEDVKESKKIEDADTDKNTVSDIYEHSEEVPEKQWWQVILGWRPSKQQIRIAIPYMMAFNMLMLGTLAVEAFAIKPVIPQNPLGREQVPLTLVTAKNVKYTADDSPIAQKMRDTLSKDVLETLNPTQVINREYEGSDGSRIEVLITAGNGRRVFHDPHTCSLGSDAVLEDIGLLHIPYSTTRGASGVVPILETHWKSAADPIPSEMLICYVVDGKIVPYTEDVRWHIMLQTLLGDAGLPSYFIRVRNMQRGTEEQKRQQVSDFVSVLWGEISPILLGKEKGMQEDPPTPPKF